MTATDPTEVPTRPACPFKGATVWTIDAVLKRIEQALAALGTTSSGVARRLAAMRCKGERGNPYFCPVSVYLRKQPIGHFEILVSSGGWLEVSARDGWVEPVRLPPAVEIFNHRFDRGEFPNCAADTSHAGDGFHRTDWAALNDPPEPEVADAGGPA